MSSPTPTRVTIIGAGGHLGRHIVTSLDANPNFQISVVTRQHSSSCDTGANFLPHIPIYCIPSNTYDNAESQLVSILTGQDIVISAIATQAVGQQRTIIDAAVKAGVKLFFPSEFGHDTRNQRAAELLPEFVCKTKRGIVQYLQSKEDAGLKWTAFVTGPVFEMAIFHYLGFDVGTKNASILDDGTHCWSATTLSTMALAVKNALLIPEETANRYLFIESFNVSQKDILTALEGLTKKLWNAIFQDAEEEKRLAFEKLSKRNYGAIPMLMRYVTCTEGYGGDYMRYEEGANKLLSLPEERLADVLARMVGE